MAITEVGNNSDGSSSGTAASVTHGLTIAADDVVIATVHGNGGPTFVDNNGANSFTKEYNASSQSSSRYAIFKRVAGASEPTDYAFTVSTSTAWSLMVRVFRGVDTASIWDVAPSGTTFDGSTGTTATAPTMTTTAAGALGIIQAFSDSSSVTYSAPSNGYGSVATHAANRSQGSAHRVFSTAGATGTTDFTLSTSDDWHIHQYALSPAATGSVALGSVLTSDVLDVLSSSKSQALGSVLTSDILGALTTGSSAQLGSLVGLGALQSVSASKTAALLGVSTSDVLAALTLAGSTPLGSVVGTGSLTTVASNRTTLLGNVVAASILGSLSTGQQTLLGSIIGSGTLTGVVSSKEQLLGSVVGEGILSALSAPTGDTTLTTQDIANIVAAMRVEGFLTVGEFLALK